MSLPSWPRVMSFKSGYAFLAVLSTLTHLASSTPCTTPRQFNLKLNGPSVPPATYLTIRSDATTQFLLNPEPGLLFTNAPLDPQGVSTYNTFTYDTTRGLIYVRETDRKTFAVWEPTYNDYFALTDSLIPLLPAVSVITTPSAQVGPICNAVSWGTVSIVSAINLVQCSSSSIRLVSDPLLVSLGCAPGTFYAYTSTDIIPATPPPQCLFGGTFNLVASVGGNDYIIFINNGPNGLYLSMSSTFPGTGALGNSQFSYDSLLGLKSHSGNDFRLHSLIDHGIFVDSAVPVASPLIGIASIFESNCGVRMATTDGVNVRLWACGNLNSQPALSLFPAGATPPGCTLVDEVISQAIGTCGAQLLDDFSIGVHQQNYGSRKRGATYDQYLTVVDEGEGVHSLAIDDICKANEFCYSSNIGDFIFRQEAYGEGLAFEQDEDGPVYLDTYTNIPPTKKQKRTSLSLITAVVYGDCSVGFLRDGVRGYIQDCSNQQGGPSLGLYGTYHYGCNDNIELFVADPVDANTIEQCQPDTTSSSSSSTSASTTDSGTITAPVYPTQTPNPTPGNHFRYFGCVGSTSSYAGFNQKQDNDLMTVEICEDACTGYKYAGLHGSTCYCSHDFDNSTSTEIAGNNTCNIPCPGDNEEACGGDISGYGSKRDVYGGYLLSVYERLPPSPEDSSTTSPSTSITPSITPGPTYSGHPFVPQTLTPGQIHITILETVIFQLCNCAAGITPTTCQVTSTMSHCGCEDDTITVSPRIPMTTTVANCPNCGPGGAPAIVTLESPCTDAACTASALQHNPGSEYRGPTPAAGHNPASGPGPKITGNAYSQPTGTPNEPVVYTGGAERAFGAGMWVSAWCLIFVGAALALPEGWM